MQCMLLAALNSVSVAWALWRGRGSNLLDGRRLKCGLRVCFAVRGLCLAKRPPQLVASGQIAENCIIEVKNYKVSELKGRQ